MGIERRDPAHDPLLAARLLEVQHAAYAVEARLIGDDRIPALHEDLAGLTSAGLSWLVAREGTTVLGALGWRPTDTGIDVDRLVVDPAYARRGTGRALVVAVLDLAGERPVTVSTGRDNTPARRLYAQAGFRDVAEREVLPGLWIVELARAPQTRTPRSATTWS